MRRIRVAYAKNTHNMREEYEYHTQRLLNQRLIT